MKFFIIDEHVPDICSSASDIIIPDKYLLQAIPEHVCKASVSILRSSITNREYYFKTIDYVCLVADRIRCSICSWLKSECDITISSKQCGYVFNYYLMELIFGLYARYLKFNGESFRNSFFSLSNNSIIPISLSDSTFKSKEYIAYIYGLILEQKGAINIGPVDTESVVNCRSVATNYVKKELKGLIDVLFDSTAGLRYKAGRMHGFVEMFRPLPKRIATHSLLIRTFLPTKDEIRLQRMSCGKIRRLGAARLRFLDYKYSKIRTVDKKRRYRMLEGFSPENEFERLLIRAFVETLPIEFCENIEYKYRKFVHIAKKYDASKVYSAGSHNGMFSVAMSQKGAEILEIQHSGAYGPFLGDSICEVKTYDEFLTWGWHEISEIGKIRPVCSTRFIGVRKEKKLEKKINRVLLIASESSLTEQLIMNYKEDYKEKHIGFVENLSEELRKKLVVRFYHDLSGIADEYRMRFPEVEIEYACEKSLHSSIQISDILILDNFSSPFFEAFLSGKPTFAYGALKFVSIRENFLKWLGYLGESELYFDSGEELAAHLCNGFQDIYDHWNSGAYNEVIDGLLEYYFGDLSDYFGKWQREFLS